jgi:type II secretory pathway pseudopilin PulG
MKRRIPHAFTLIEMVTVVAVIIVLAGLIISVAGFVNTKAAREKALAQIKNYSLQSDAYKLDNGTVPQNADTDLLDARMHFSPVGGSSGTLYQNASRYLYSCLSGDLDPALRPDYKPEAGNKVYYGFKRDELNCQKNADGAIQSVNYIQDPFGNCYGYSTIGAKAENDYREKLKLDSSTARPDQPQGYNPTFDLWSTGGGTTQSQAAKWVKNWGN